ncbi:protein N-lysine methyltransferase METTL21D-like [Tubulanus polymorphus]|uniref:protein N-lysine methyltransferase METTL21D-like n=1 Tax=Tubulanus polymorphus TaxID=672921 RepID=UPI003DA5C393
MIDQFTEMDPKHIFVREFEKDDGSILKINQYEIGDVGCVVWDAALVLSSFLETGNLRKYYADKPLSTCTVIELGAGTGIVGLELASLGANVIVTDLEEFVPLLKMNVDANENLLAAGSAAVRTLKWGQDLSPEFERPDLIFMADCIYYEESLEPLVKTIKDLCRADTCVFCCFEQRTTGNKPELERRFLELIGENFTIDTIPHRDHHVNFTSSDIQILKFSPT